MLLGDGYVRGKYLYYKRESLKNKNKYLGSINSVITILRGVRVLEGHWMGSVKTFRGFGTTCKGIPYLQL